MHEDPGSGEEHEGERELEDDKAGSKPASAMAANAARAFLQDLIEVGARGAQSGRNAEEQAAADTEGGEVAEDGVVHGELHPVGFADVRGGECEPVDAKGSEAEAEGSTDDAEDDTFDEELADDTPARGAERGADGHLTLAGDGAAQHHVGDVGAGNEENESNGGQHEEEDHFDVAAVVALVEGQNEGVVSLFVSAYCFARRWAMPSNSV